jgi:hypothetical protein
MQAVQTSDLESTMPHVEISRSMVIWKCCLPQYGPILNKGYASRSSIHRVVRTVAPSTHRDRGHNLLAYNAVRGRPVCDHVRHNCRCHGTSNEQSLISRVCYGNGQIAKAHHRVSPTPRCLKSVTQSRRVAKRSHRTCKSAAKSLCTSQREVDENRGPTVIFVTSPFPTQPAQNQTSTRRRENIPEACWAQRKMAFRLSSNWYHTAVHAMPVLSKAPRPFGKLAPTSTARSSSWSAHSPAHKRYACSKAQAPEY